MNTKFKTHPAGTGEKNVEKGNTPNPFRESLHPNLPSIIELPNQEMNSDYRDYNDLIISSIIESIGEF